MLRFWSIINIETIILWLQCRDISASISIANLYDKKNMASCVCTNNFFYPKYLFFDLMSDVGTNFENVEGFSTMDYAFYNSF